MLGVLGVGLLGVLAAQLWGRRVALVAMALAAVYVPSILVATAIMSEQLFVVLMLAATRDRDRAAGLAAPVPAGGRRRLATPGWRC